MYLRAVNVLPATDSLGISGEMEETHENKWLFIRSTANNAIKI